MITNNFLTATHILDRIQQGKLSSVESVRTCLDRIAEREPIVQAWECLEPDYALEQAKHHDLVQSQQQPIGALHGIPIAIKDTFATRDLPTGWGTSIHAGQQLGFDAAVIARLRAAGAVIMGKTVTTEYAMARAGKTRNPHHPKHTPGASSSGSAAAVADGMVPLAIGTQTVGSILRPAAYCGIFGFKPSFGLISRYGALPSSRDLDHVGLFARSVADIALLLEVLAGADGRDPDCYGYLPACPANLFNRSQPPRLALIFGPYVNQLQPEAKNALENSATALRKAGATITEITLPSSFDDYFDHVQVLASVGMAAHHGADFDRHADQMSAKLRQIIEQGRIMPSLTYAATRQTVVEYSQMLTKLFCDVDAILTPVTTGTAPYGLENTGSPIFCALWTLCGLPAVNIPVGYGSNGLPLGVQLVGQRGQDWQVLAIAQWIRTYLS
ncbi:MAG: amidase [Elainellaceae cyanobacterium]